MTLDEFVAEEQARLLRFQAWYRDGHIREPDAWPLEANKADWFEQLEFFEE